jgi:membrane-associated phospholipid phosphatase
VSPIEPRTSSTAATASSGETPTGASTALYFSLLLLAAARIERDWLRRVLMTGCAVIPFLVGTARLYRGAHHISDVLAGMLNGVVCAVLAYQWYRHRVRSEATSRQLVSAGRVS